MKASQDTTEKVLALKNGLSTFALYSPFPDFAPHPRGTEGHKERSTVDKAFAPRAMQGRREFREVTYQVQPP